MITTKRAAASVAFLIATACCTPTTSANLPPTVVLLTSTETGMPAGSGVVIAQGWVLTASHVLPVGTADGLDVAEVIEHPTLDLALLRVPGLLGYAVPLADELPKLHDPVHAIGWHLARQLQRTDGYQGGQPGQMSAPIIHGCSGGAVLNEAGELVGIIMSVGYTNTWTATDGSAVPQAAGYTPITADVVGWISYNLNP